MGLQRSEIILVTHDSQGILEGSKAWSPYKSQGSDVCDHVFWVVQVWLGCYVVIIAASVDLSLEVFAIDIIIALKSFLKRHHKHILRWLRVYREVAEGLYPKILSLYICMYIHTYIHTCIHTYINKTNDLILNLTPENVTRHSRIVTTTCKGSSTRTKMSKIIGRQIHWNVKNWQNQYIEC